MDYKEFAAKMDVLMDYTERMERASGDSTTALHELKILKDHITIKYLRGSKGYTWDYNERQRRLREYWEGFRAKRAKRIVHF